MLKVHHQDRITFNSALLKELRVAMHMRDRFGSASANRLHRALWDDSLSDFSLAAKLNTEAAWRRSDGWNGKLGHC